MRCNDSRAGALTWTEVPEQRTSGTLAHPVLKSGDLEPASKLARPDRYTTRDMTLEALADGRSDTHTADRAASQARCDAARRREVLERRSRFTRADADEQAARAQAFAAATRRSRLESARQRLAAPPPDPRHVPPAQRRQLTQGQKMLAAALRAPPGAPAVRGREDPHADTPRKRQRFDADRQDHPPIP